MTRFDHAQAPHPSISIPSMLKWLCQQAAQCLTWLMGKGLMVNRKVWWWYCHCLCNIDHDSGPVWPSSHICKLISAIHESYWNEIGPHWSLTHSPRNIIALILILIVSGINIACHTKQGPSPSAVHHHFQKQNQFNSQNKLSFLMATAHDVCRSFGRSVCVIHPRSCSTFLVTSKLLTSNW